MKIKVTYGEINNKGNWEKFCELKGLDIYCMNNYGISEEEVELTIEEVSEIDLIVN